MRRICLVGAGNIARVHAEVLRGLPACRVAAVVDPDLSAARRLAHANADAACFASARQAIDAGGLDAAHVLVPPDAHHDTALPFLAAGVPVLVEKPLAATGQACASLIDAARSSSTVLGVNQNFLFHPAFVALRRWVEGGRYGRPRFVDAIYSMPLRQLAARQFGHWMFRAPVNILLEQAVHPLSQLRALAGPFGALRVVASPAETLAPGLRLNRSVNVSLAGARLPAQLHFAVGQSFPVWQIRVVCDDGLVVADIGNNRAFAQARTMWPESIDDALSAGRTGAAMMAAGTLNLGRYALSQVRLVPRADAFFRSMQGGIRAFHDAVGSGTTLEADGAFGKELVETCERIAAEAFDATAAAPLGAPVVHQAPAASGDVAVLGGTGFIGTATVRHLLAAGHRVRVMARNVAGLSEVFSDPRVTVVRGDIGVADHVRDAIGDAGVVVNLAHGGGGGDFAAIRAAMVDGAETILRTCQARGVSLLVHVGSIAALYLGPQTDAVTGATPPDPRSELRADYARAKAECDRMLLARHVDSGAPVIILRPGLVLGEGTSPFHSGFGVFNNQQHCIGWNRGRNPLPCVLVDDVASAIVAATQRPALSGRCYNLVGDVRPTAREYIATLGEALGRPLRFHPQVPSLLWAEEGAKWLIKRAGGRRSPTPSRRDLLSRGLSATFDCSDAMRDLAWRPVADPAAFRARAIDIHAE